MRLKLKYGVPLAQMLVAVAFLVWTDCWERVLIRLNDMAGTPASFTLLMAINAPLAIPRALVVRYLPGWWDDITLVVAIGMFWYWVSLNIESLQQSCRVFMFSRIPLRLAGDTVALAIGAVWIFLLWRNRSFWLPEPSSLTDWLRFVPCIFLPIFRPLCVRSDPCKASTFCRMR